MLELEIQHMERNFFMLGDDSHTITLTLFVKEVSLFIKNRFVIRLEETEDTL